MDSITKYIKRTTKAKPEKASQIMEEAYFFGEHNCSKPTCSNKAYFKSQNSSVLLCGVHSKSIPRTKLPKNPNAKQIQIQKQAQHQKEVQQAQKLNQSSSKPGQVVCTPLRMMKLPEDIKGFQKVFPNFRHGNRTDGLGLPSLSPMKLGPVVHNQKDLPLCKTLENFHQFNKVYPQELNDEGKISDVFWKKLKSGYKSDQGQRHKYGRQDKPKFSVHKIGDEVRRYTYIQSRWFYCHHYEKLTEGNGDLEMLRKLKREGTNLQLVGYDGYPIEKDLYDVYCDPRRPFGHESVLYVLLTVDSPEEYPWNLYFLNHRELYELKKKDDSDENMSVGDHS